MKKKIGILALQGAFIEHEKILNSLNCDIIYVKISNDLNNLDGLIIPGGESTTIKKLILDDSDLYKSLCNFIKKKPVWGICAGMVLLSKYINNNNIRENGLFSNLDCVPIEIERNYYGSQINSFTKIVDFSNIGINKFKCIFIRAPKIKNSDEYFLIYKNILVTSFHPELTNDIRFHSFFINICGHN